MTHHGTALLVATMDIKGLEAIYLADCLTSEVARRQLPDRPYHVHNAAITVARTKTSEIEALAKIIAEPCKRARGPWKILVPMNGFSAFDHPDGPLYDPAAPPKICCRIGEKFR